MSRPVRGVDVAFVEAMNAKLDEGRRKGYVGWDTRWGKTGECYVWDDECTPVWCIKRILQEAVELSQIIENGSPEDILKECADIANFAMMCADSAEALPYDEVESTKVE